MSWNGHTRFGNGYVEFVGRVGDNSSHAHPAYQLVFGQKDVSVRLENGEAIEGAAIYIRPGVKHRVCSSGIATLLLVEPQSPLGRYLDKKLNERGAGHFDQSLRQIRSVIDQQHLSAIDARLQVVMQTLAGPDALQLSIASLARKQGISPQRLRELASEQIGITLGRWRLWTALGRACVLMSEGASTAAAAYDAGFSDQAHLARTMRQTLGITPSAGRQALRTP